VIGVLAANRWYCSAQQYLFHGPHGSVVRRKLCLPLGAITNLLEGAHPSLVRLDIDGDLEPILFESLRAYTEQEQTTAQITATLEEGEPMALTRGVWSATNVQLA
jgi:hypothetical protein